MADDASFVGGGGLTLVFTFTFLPLPLPLPVPVCLSCARAADIAEVSEANDAPDCILLVCKARAFSMGSLCYSRSIESVNDFKLLRADYSLMRSHSWM